MRPAIASVLALAATGALAQGADPVTFNRVASFRVAANTPEGADPAEETSAEIVAATGDGLTLIYTNSPAGLVGLIDIADPASPQPLGSLPVDGEPTSVATLGQTAFVAVNSSESYPEPSGHLLALDVGTRAETARCDLGGQPDSVAVAPDGTFLAVAVENERDEEAGDGRVPQMPGGFVAIVPLADGSLDCAGLVRADLTGLAEVAPEDPEPEFVDVNAAGEIVVTLQENNHVAVLDRAGAVLSHFSAGAVDLAGIDTADDGRLDFSGEQPGQLREPDAVKWIDDDRFAVANEGDLDAARAGSRSSPRMAPSCTSRARPSRWRWRGPATTPTAAPTRRARSPSRSDSPASTARPSSSWAPSAARWWRSTTSPTPPRPRCGRCSPRASGPRASP